MAVRVRYQHWADRKEWLKNTVQEFIDQLRNEGITDKSGLRF
jgi:hypothetical protein